MEGQMLGLGPGARSKAAGRKRSGTATGGARNSPTTTKGGARLSHTMSTADRYAVRQAWGGDGSPPGGSGSPGE